MTRLLYHDIYANSGTQELKLQVLRVPKTLFYDFKVAINFNIVKFKVTIMPYDPYAA